MSGNKSISTSTVAQLVVLGAIWGGAFTLLKVLVEVLSPVEIAAGRLSLGALAVVAILQVRHDLRWPGRGLLVPIAVVAMLDTLIPYMLVGWASSHIHSGTASILISAMPLFTVVFAAATMREETVGPARLAGIAVGFAGIMVLVGSPAGLVRSGAIGRLVVVGAAASYAAGALYARTLLNRIDAGNLTATKLTLGAGLATAARLGTGGGGGLAAMDGRDALALVVLGVLCTGISFALYFQIVASAGSVVASTVTYIIPVFGVLFGVVLLGESLEGRTVAGMALIIAGVAAVMYPRVVEGVAARLLPRRKGWSTA